MASLDFSYIDVEGPSKADRPSLDVSSLVDQASLGIVKDGIYEVKDWEFASTSELSASAISQALVKEKEKPSSIGALGNIFARLTGSKVLSEEDLKPVLEAMKQHLMKKNVAKEISEKVCEGVGDSLIGKKVGSFQCKSVRYLFVFSSQLTSSSSTCFSQTCSNLIRFPTGPFHLPHAYPHAEDVDRPPALHSHQTILTSSILAAT